MDAVTLFGFFLVFVRCSALLLSSPIFGAQTTPVHIRIMTTLAIAAALAPMVRSKLGPAPTDLLSLFTSTGHEVFVGLLIGSMMNFALQALQIAGGLMDLQIGLGMSHTINPVNGVQSSVLSQYKFMLGVVVFLSANGHHVLIQALIHSYDAAPMTAQTIPTLKDSLVVLLGQMFLIAMQIAAPVLGVGFLIDAALGLMNRAVPQMQAMVVGAPAKIALGLMAVSVGLPAIVSGTSQLVERAVDACSPVLNH